MTSAQAADKPASDAPIPSHKVGPYFPIDAACVLKEGDTTIQVQVDDDGDVRDLQTVSEEPKNLGFSRSARLALQKWQFAKGHPGVYIAKFHFALDPELTRLKTEPPPPRDPKEYRRQPMYPLKAEDQSIPGDVVTILTVNDKGLVDKADMYQEVPVGMYFGDAAIQAVKAWKFKEGRPGRYVVCVKFRMR